jgi:hypothetical protein
MHVRTLDYSVAFSSKLLDFFVRLVFRRRLPSLLALTSLVLGSAFVLVLVARLWQVE